MSKSKTKKVKLKTTPHEELLKELEYLRAENAYLKKLQALVEERIVRESGKEPKPSKDQGRSAGFQYCSKPQGWREAHFIITSENQNNPINMLAKKRVL